MFTWIPDKNFIKKVDPRVLEIGFNTSYTNRGVDGINFLERSWDLRFSNRSKFEIDNIDSFLSDKNGYISFDWTPLDEKEIITVICPTWTKSNIFTYGEAEGLASLSANFIQVF